MDLILPQKYHNELDVVSFQQMLKDPSYCYKFYWLEALVVLITEGKTETTFDELIDEMISRAWYSVREFHIHLSGTVKGEVRDGLEQSVVRLAELSGLPSNASRTEIKNAIRTYNAELNETKTRLTKMVPYRALAGFFLNTAETPNWGSTVQMTDFILRYDRTVDELPYTLGPSSGLRKEVYFSSAWNKLIQDNAVSILGWIQHEKIKWLQMNNVEVPGLVFKLAPLDDKMRRLTHVRNLWREIMKQHSVRDIYTGRELQSTDFDVDHFVPWSFLMNDEMWNLLPMDSSLNSAKSNRLPNWDMFFPQFAKTQFSMFRAVQGSEKLHSLFDACYKDNMHSIWAERELYRSGISLNEFGNVLSKNMRPFYDSAYRQGYEMWNFRTPEVLYGASSTDTTLLVAEKLDI